MNKVEKIQAEIKRELQSLTNANTDFALGRYTALNNILSFIGIIKEEPVSDESLEKAAVAAFKQIVDSDKNNFLEIFKAGAQWQEEQLMKDAVYGLVCGHDDNSPAWIDFNLLNKPDVKVGEEIKLIIIREE